MSSGVPKKVWIFFFVAFFIFLPVVLLFFRNGNKEERLATEVTAISQGKLPPLQKVPVKPKEEVWIFGWTATDELMNENHQQKPYSEYIATDVTCSEKKLNFVCFKGKKQEDKIVLTRENKEQAYVGYLFNKIKKEYTPIWLTPEKDGFKGYIFANNGPKIIATLKKAGSIK